jgi:predicted phosphodiesterase
MNIQIQSDLHLNHHADQGYGYIQNMVTKDVDVLVLAGDICGIPTLVKFDNLQIREICKKYPQVITVMGNHEPYGFSAIRSVEYLKELEVEIPNFHFLSNEKKVIEGQEFYGGTMWFRDDWLNAKYRTGINDFRYIRDFEPWVYEQNTQFLDGLETIDPKTVVISHHLPVQECIAKQYQHNPINRFFMCDVHKQIRKYKPQLWIHGHTHTPVDFQYYDTRIICNPLGYVGECSNLAFNDNLIVEV